MGIRHLALRPDRAIVSIGCRAQSYNGRSVASHIKAQIVAAAAKCFAAKGYRGTSTKDIADEAGVNETSLFRLFRDKEALFVAATQRAPTPVPDLVALLASEPDFRRAIRLLVDRLCRRATEPLMRIGHFAALEGIPSRRRPMRTFLKYLIRTVAARIRSEQRAGRLRPCNPQHAALILCSLIYHHRTLYYIFDCRQPPVAPLKATLDGMVECWLDGLKKSK